MLIKQKCANNFETFYFDTHKTTYFEYNIEILKIGTRIRKHVCLPKTCVYN